MGVCNNNTLHMFQQSKPVVLLITPLGVRFKNFDVHNQTKVIHCLRANVTWLGSEYKQKFIY